MPDESPAPTPEYDTHERLGALSESCGEELVTMKEAAEAACQEKEDLGKLAENLFTETYRAALLADNNDVGSQAAREILADYLKILTTDATFPIGTRVEKLRVLKAERMRTVTEQLGRIENVRVAHGEPTKQLLTELETLGGAVRKYDQAVAQGFEDIQYCEQTFVDRAGTIYGDEIAAESKRKPESAVLKALQQTYENRIGEIREKRRTTKFIDSSHRATMQNSLGEILKRIVEEEANLESYLSSKDMRQVS